MSSPIIYQVLFGLLFLFFCYLTYMFTKTWRWPHVTISFFVFTAAIAVCISSAKTVATHMAWKKAVYQLTQQYQKGSGERNQLLHGDIKQTIQDTPSIRSLHAKLGRTLLDRGRAWRNCTPTQGDQNTVTVRTAPPGVADADAAPNRIVEGLVLYAFVESEIPVEFTEPPLSLPAGTKMPWYYVGEFTADSVTDTGVMLRWTMPPLAKYEAWVTNNLAGRTITLYETMPVDGHRYFATDLDKEPDLSDGLDEQPIFGEMNEEFIRQLFQPHQDNVGAAWESMIQPYIRDGGRAADDELPENTWLKVRFTKSHKEQVDSVGDPLGGVTESESFFDGQGNANVPIVRRGGDGELKVDDWGVFPTQNANQLINAGVCELAEPVFVRSVHSYDYSLSAILQQLIQLAQDQGNVKRNTEAATESNRRTEEQIAFRRQEQQKLNEDLAKFQIENQRVTEFAGTLEQQKTDRMNELSELFQSNLQLVEELTRVERELTEQINRRTAKAIAETGAE